MHGARVERLAVRRSDARNAGQPAGCTHTRAQPAVAAAAVHLPADFRSPMLAHFLRKQVRSMYQACDTATC